MAEKSVVVERPRSQAELVNRLTATLVALPWTVVGPYQMQPEEGIPETWAIHCMELPNCVVYCETAAKCEKEWPDCLHAFMMAYAAYGELPPRLPVGFSYLANTTYNSGGIATVRLTA
jgi:hypothetical protein